jgi:hypothetical protein
MKRRKLVVPVYEFDLLVYLGGTWPEFYDAMVREKALSVIKGSKRTDSYAGFVSDDGAFRVWVQTDDPSTVSHEATHLSWSIMRAAGVPVCYSNEESQAYLIGYLSEEITKLFRKAFKAKT